MILYSAYVTLDYITVATVIYMETDRRQVAAQL